MIGASLVLRYPGIASVPCSRCIEILGDFIDGEWVPSTRCGKEIERPKGSKTPCWKCPKLSLEDRKGENPNPSMAVELSDNNRRAWDYYNEVQAGATMADDPITRRFCGALRRLERKIEQENMKSWNER